LKKNKCAAFDAEQEKWYISIVDVIEILTGTDRPRKYWSDFNRENLIIGLELKF
jgi:hypothetical protein